MIKHAEVLKAIADGKDAQCNISNKWIDVRLDDCNPLTHSRYIWRVKPDAAEEAWEEYRQESSMLSIDIFKAGFKAGNESKND